MILSSFVSANEFKDDLTVFVETVGFMVRRSELIPILLSLPWFDYVFLDFYSDFTVGKWSDSLEGWFCCFVSSSFCTFIG